LTVAAQSADPTSMLHLYRDMLARRRVEPCLGDGPLTWLESAPQVLAFSRGDLLCVVNLGEQAAELPPHADVLLTSGPLAAGRLPRDTAAWLRAAPDPNQPAVPARRSGTGQASLEKE
jgi:alpha-glucosidase